MTFRSKVTADLLFGVQIIGAFVLCVSQFIRLLTSTNGQLLCMFLGIEIFIALHLLLAVAALRDQPNRITKQAVWIYALWVVLIGTNIIAFFLNGHYRWSENDTRTGILILVGVGTVMSAMRIRKIGLGDPMVKGLLAMIFKALPQDEFRNLVHHPRRLGGLRWEFYSSVSSEDGCLVFPGFGGVVHWSW